MTTETTLEEVWRLFREVAAQSKVTDEKLARAFEAIELSNRRHAETEAAMARSRTETDAALDAALAAMARSRAETEAAFRETDRKIGKLSDRIGEFAEGMVIPAVRRLFQDRGIAVHHLSRHVEAEYGGRRTEFDIIMRNARHVVAIEVKSRLKVSDVADYLSHMADFKNYFPEYANRAVIGAVAGIVVDDDAARFAYRQGLFVLAQSGDTVRFLNDEAFRPKEW